MHYEKLANLTFYILAIIASLIMVMGVVSMVHIWRLGKAPTLNRNINGRQWTNALLKASFFETQILEYSYK